MVAEAVVDQWLRTKALSAQVKEALTNRPLTRNWMDLCQYSAMRPTNDVMDRLHVLLDDPLARVVITIVGFVSAVVTITSVVLGNAAAAWIGIAFMLLSSLLVVAFADGFVWKTLGSGGVVAVVFLAIAQPWAEDGQTIPSAEPDVPPSSLISSTPEEAAAITMATDCFSIVLPDEWTYTRQRRQDPAPRIAFQWDIDDGRRLVVFLRDQGGRTLDEELETIASDIEASPTGEVISRTYDRIKGREVARLEYKRVSTDYLERWIYLAFIDDTGTFVGINSNDFDDSFDAAFRAVNSWVWDPAPSGDCMP